MRRLTRDAWDGRMAVAMKYTAAELRGERKSIASIPGKDLTHIRIQAVLGVQRNSGFRSLRVVELFTGCVNVRCPGFEMKTLL